VNEFLRGGNGGFHTTDAIPGMAGQSYGDGGSGGGGFWGRSPGGTGHAGIVVIRFKRNYLVED
jgi:hypothetical protein